MFSQACVKISVHRGWERYTPPGQMPTGQTPLLCKPPMGRHPPTPDGHGSRRYISYWNAFSFVLFIHLARYYCTHWDNPIISDNLTKSLAFIFEKLTSSKLHAMMMFHAAPLVELADPRGRGSVARDAYSPVV